MATVPRSASGARRTGDDYQDAVALEYMVTMLEHKDRLQYIKVEATEAGALDDVVVRYSDQRVEYIQVKHATYPDSENSQFDWPTFLERTTGKKGTLLPSLLQKWSRSLAQLVEAGDHQVDARLTTNRRPSASVAQAFDSTTRTIAFSKIPEPVQRDIIDQIGDQSQIDRFFSKFKFDFDFLDLDTLATAAWTRFHRLGGTTEGWLNLKDTLRGWIRDRASAGPNQEIRLNAVRNAALWGKLAGLPQRFPIPSDYVLPSAKMHADVLQLIQAEVSTHLVIVGQPGIGKSTYLSYLFKNLEEHAQPVVRHHFFLTLNETSGDRYKHEKVVYSLMNDLKAKYSDALGDAEGLNPRPEVFGTWLDSCSEYFIERKSKLVVILDGLDHVWREKGDLTELKLLLEYFHPTRKGIVLVLGSQPIQLRELPYRILAKMPEDQWIELEALNRESVLQWTVNHSAQLEQEGKIHEPEPLQELSRIATALFELSLGHPLILRYTLRSFLASDRGIEAFRQDSKFQLKSTDIEEYYNYLWASLPLGARTMLAIVSIIHFSWTKEALLQCSVLYGYNKLDSQIAWTTIEHLFVRDSLGWRFFHGSILVFIREKAEYKESIQESRAAVVRWLGESAPEIWKWSFHWTLESESGNSQLLTDGTTRQWVVRSLKMGLPAGRTKEILRQSAEESLKKKNFRAFVEVALLCDYVESQFAYVDSTTKGRWVATQLELQELPSLPELLYSTRNQLSTEELMSVGHYFAKNGNTDWLESIYLDLVDRQRTSKETSSFSNRLAQVEPLIAIEAIRGNIDLERLEARIERNYTSPDLDNYCYRYSRRLYAGGKLRELRNLSRSDKEYAGKRHFLRHLVMLSIEQANDCTAEVLLLPQESFSAIYLKKNSVEGLLQPNAQLPDARSLVEKSRVDLNEREMLSQGLYDLFFQLLAFRLWGAKLSIELWLDDIGMETWLGELIHRLSDLSELAATSIENHTPLSMSDCWEVFETARRPEFRNDRPDWDWWIVARQRLPQIIFDTLVLTKRDGPPEVGTSFLIHFSKPVLLDRAVWIDEYAARGRKLLSFSDLEYLKASLEDSMTMSPEELADNGVVEFTNLAWLFAFHGHPNAEAYLARAMDLTLSYGHRKDILLSEHVDVLEKLAGHDSGFVSEQLNLLLPAALGVLEYTDGKETRHVPSRVFEVLESVDPKRLLRIYLHLANAREYYMLEDLVDSIVSSMTFTSNLEKQFASTLFFGETRDRLKSLGDAGRSDLTEILKKFEERPEYEQAENSGGTKKQQSDRPSREQEETEIDVSKHSPETLTALFESTDLRIGLDRKELLARWVSYWELHADAETLVGALTELHNRERYVYCAWHIYKLVVKTDGRQSAYKWLVIAFVEFHGWSTYWNDSSDAVRIWNEVAEHYPNKWHEFVLDTLNHDSSRREGFSVHGRLNRFVDYFLMINQPQAAIEAVRGSSDALTGLTSPFQIPEVVLPYPDFETSKLVLEVLLTRLTWPVGNVRESACNAIANLLLDPKLRSSVLDSLFTWISSQTLESRSFIGLLPLAKARSLGNKFQMPSQDKLLSICLSPSVQYYAILSLLFPLDRRDLPANLGFTDFGSFNEGRMSEFVETIRRNVAPIYETDAKRHEASFGRHFFRQWAAEYYQLLASHSGSGRSDDSNFRGRGADEHYFVFDTFVGEILQSAYVRALAWLSSFGEHEKLFALLTGLRVIPIDLGLWSTQIRSRPDWWPVLLGDAGDKIDTLPGRVVEAINKLWQDSRGESSQIAMISGRIAETSSIYDVTLYGIFQRRIGQTTPTAEEIFDAAPWLEGNLAPSTLVGELRGHLLGPDPEEVEVRVGDWFIVPATLRVSPRTFPKWQYWRMLREFCGPNPVLAEGNALEVLCEPGGVAYSDKQRRIATWQDWVGAKIEMAIADLTPRSGQFLTIDKKVIDSFADKNDLTFCWVFEISRYSRKHSHELFDCQKFFGIVGHSNVIRP